jgi:threonine/homoserine/homoserine lactone efflux protein
VLRNVGATGDNPQENQRMGKEEAAIILGVFLALTDTKAMVFFRALVFCF